MSLNRELSIRWFGHSAFQVDTPGGKRILIDPFLNGNPLCPNDCKQVERCDLLLVTHGHGDHVGDTIAISNQTGCRIITMVELAGWLTSRGAQNVTEMNKGGTVKHGDIAVTMVHAIHSTGIEDGGQIVYGGEPAGFVVKLEDGFTFYHAGDTCVFGDMALIGELYRPELAMLPIGDHYTMSPLQAAKAVRLLGVKNVIPMHYGTFPVLTGTPEELKKLLADRPDVTIHAIRPGEYLD